MRRNSTRLLVAALPWLALWAALGPAAGLGAAFRGPDSFLDSDDYRDGEEVVGVFLDESEYATRTTMRRPVLGAGDTAAALMRVLQ
jgi:hypothetical protein